MADLSNYLENAFANALRGGGAGTSYTAPAAVYVKLHTGAPGEDGSSNASANTTRVAITFGAASNGVITSSNAPSWATWAAGSETISHISLWDASTSGNCLTVGALAASKSVANGDTLTLSSGAVTVTLA